jgi:uncharacterized membrane protein YkvA (DUF1232 family)
MARSKSRRGGWGVIRTLNLLAFLPLASRAPLYGRLLWALATDPRVPTSRKALLGLAAAYVISPFELIPDYVPVLGALDDVVVVVIAVDAFLEGVPEGLINEKLLALGMTRSELDDDLARVRRSVPKPVREIFARLPDAIEGIAGLVARSGLDARLEELVGRHVGAEDQVKEEETVA